MKKISKTIAMILVLIMLASSFSGCYTYKTYKEGHMPLSGWELDYILAPLVDLIIIGAIGLGILMLATGSFAETPNETGIYLASAENNPLTQYYSAIEEMLNSLPEVEKAAFVERINSLTEAEINALVSTVASLPQAEITASIERLNALSERELRSTVKKFKSLNETEMDSFLYQLSQRVIYLPGSVAFAY
jgi:hypothetical protein